MSHDTPGHDIPGPAARRGGDAPLPETGPDTGAPARILPPAGPPKPGYGLGSTDVPPPGMFGPLSPTYRIKRRQARIREEIERNRRGGQKVPTWVLALILLVLIGGWLALILLVR